MKRRILSIALTIVMLLSSVLSVVVVDAASLTSWEWNSNGNNENWVCNENISSGIVENGYYSLNISGGDAHIISPETSFPASRFPKIEITYRNSTEDTNAELFWACSNGDWSSARSLGFSTIADGQWHTVTVDLSQSIYWTGTITQLRLDPTQNGEGLFEIDKLHFITSTEQEEIWNFGVEGNFEGWSVNEVTSGNVQDGALVLDVNGQADPSIVNYSSTIDTTIYKKLLLTYRNATDSTTSEFYWSSLDECWTSDKKKKFDTVNDGDWHTVIIDLSGEDTWVDTVKNLRIDPVANTTGTFEIDKIALGSADAVLQTGVTNVASEISWNWTENGKKHGWTETNTAEDLTTVANGSVTYGIIFSTDPYICSPELTMDASVYNKMEITYRTTIDDTQARLFWRKDGTDFTQPNSQGFTLNNNGDWNCLVLDLSEISSWSGVLSQLRLDFVDNGTGWFEIDKIRFVSPTPVTDKLCTVEGADTVSWKWDTNKDYQGWSFNQDVKNWDVAGGNLVSYIGGGTDPIIIGPEFEVEASKYTILEIKYKNNIANDKGKLYWEVNNGGWTENASCDFTTISDGKWHTVQFDLSENNAWRGKITQLRIDPTTGGAGHFYIDRIALMDAEPRYIMSNGYIHLSGVNGAIDTLKFDPDGTADYGENMLMGELCMSLKYKGVVYTSSGSDVTWKCDGKTLSIYNIKFGNSGIKGKWTLALNGNKLDNTFTVTSEIASAIELNEVGYCYDMVWENEGYEVEADPGVLRVPFSKMISSDDRYHSVYAYKRMPTREDDKEDMETMGFTGSWLDLEGANGYDFNLRFSFDTGQVSPVCYVDHLNVQFRGKGTSVTIGAGSSLVKTLGIEVSHNGDITPEHFVSFESSDAEFAEAVNNMLYEFGNSRERACTHPDWAEWISTIRCWQDDNYIEAEKLSVSSYYQHPNGYVNTWGPLTGWPFPEDKDSNHYITTAANLINAVYNYYVYDGDESFLNNNLSRLRLAVDFLLSQFDENYGVLKIDNPDHNGTRKSYGSNYWDITPYGNLSAYDNIYGYLAITKMAEIEKALGKTARAEELENYAETIKFCYNYHFWAGDHYIQCIDVNNERHDYGCVYLNLEAITYGLADEDRAAVILDWMSNTPTSTGEADVFSKFVFSPRVTMFDNPNWDEGWYCGLWPGGEEYGTEQIQNGGTIFYIAYYELMSRVKAYGGDNAYARLEEIINRFNIEHLQGGTLATGETHQHYESGLVGCWGEFPENGLVATSVKNGIMGIDADMSGLHVTPDMPSDLSDLTLNQVNFRDMSLDITTTATSVRIKARENNNRYTDWVINGKKVSGLFDVTVDISDGETVSLYRDAEAYKTYTLTFDAGENGTLSGETEITVDSGTELSTLTFPTVKANVGYIFTGWSQTEGTITSDITVTAQYEEGYRIGDVNRDGEITIVDATEIQKKLVRLVTFDEEQTMLADVDGNGRVSVKDVTYIQMYIAKIIEKLPV